MESVKTTIYPDQVTNLEEIIFQKPPIYKDGIFRTGLILIGLSAFAFFLAEFMKKSIPDETAFGFFIFNYALTTCYFFVLLVGGLLKIKWKNLTKNYTENILLFLVLGLISAYALNRLIPLFEQSTPWLAIFLVVLSGSLVALCFRKQLPKLVNYGLYFIVGSGMVLYAYFSIYLLPFYHLGILGAILLGFSLHVFIPLFSLLFIGVHVFKAARQDKFIKYAGLTGIIFPFLVLGIFLLAWKNGQNQINYAINKSISEAEPLPAWIAVSRDIPKTPLAEKLIKTDLVYSTPNKNGWWSFNLPNRAFEETRKHDPLVMISTLLLGKPDLSEEDRINILEAMYDSRHKTLERLWAGNALQTSNVSSNVRIFPEYRMAYTEKNLSIRNTHPGRWSQQEALYTFHLPEGGVVTSLSLWINGREEKGILTTKAQADSAYKTIVGVEARDPSVVHWQEGNTVSVRVFPCTPEEDRRFKIGVTAPLRKDGNKLVYESLYFDGPETTNATESVRIQFSEKPNDLDLPFNFKKEGSGFLSNGNFRNYWEISMQATPLSKQVFAFDGRQYQVQEYQKAYEQFRPTAIYLDLNAAWNGEELMDLWDNIKTLKVFAYSGKMIRLTDENLVEVFEELKSQNFSLFPLHHIPDPDNALLISKSTSLSPNLQDLQSSLFGQQLKNAMQKPEKVRVYNLGEELSPYLKTLKEFRAFAYDQGTLKELTKMLQEQKFVTNAENNQTVVIHDAGLKIIESSGGTAGNAPDHLLRLFTYNHLLQQIGSNYFTPNFFSEELIAQAQKAYVISPLSSLVVLETQADYDRFNIKDSQNQSLRNASMHGSGSVPEPHEWFLIIMVATVAVYLYFRPSMVLKRR